MTAAAGQDHEARGDARDDGDPSGPLPERVRAVRGATTLEADVREQLIARTGELVRQLLDRNGLTPDDLVSLVFTATDDVRCGYPAEAAREAGITRVPLLCARELEVPGGIARCVRVLAHAYTRRAARDLRHVYLHGARQLRTDLPE